MDVKKNVIFAAKVVAHGAVFSVLAYAVTLLWAYVIPILFLATSLVVLLLTLVGLSVLWGLLNTLISRALWFPMEKGWRTWVGQGIFLGLALNIVNVLPLLIGSPFINRLDATPRIALYVVLIVLYAFLVGYIALRVARHWKQRGSGIQAAAEGTGWTPEPDIPPNNPGNLHCPRCGSVKMVVAPDRSALCLDCSKGIRAEKLGGKTASPPS